MLRSLDVPLNGDDLFVPGLRRGYAILPIVPKPFEDEDARRLLRMSNAAAMIRRWLRELAVVLRERAPGDNIFLLLEEAMQAVRRNEDTEPADNGTVGGMGPCKKRRILNMLSISRMRLSDVASDEGEYGTRSTRTSKSPRKTCTGGQYSSNKL